MVAKLLVVRVIYKGFCNKPMHSINVPYAALPQVYT